MVYTRCDSLSLSLKFMGDPIILSSDLSDILFFLSYFYIKITYSFKITGVIKSILFQATFFGLLYYIYTRKLNIELFHIFVFSLYPRYLILKFEK